MKDEIFVNASYSFSFSAEDVYNFVFDNTHLDKDKKVIFILKEPPRVLFRFGMINFFFMLPVGLALVIVGYVYEKWRTTNNK